jgi:4-hydroxy-3-methylbut-2-enyl diphosphate reductase
MVDSAAELKPEWLSGKTRIGVTAGASAPEVLVRDVVAQLKAMGAQTVVERSGVVETVVFALPRGLAGKAHAKVPEIGPREV